MKVCCRVFEASGKLWQHVAVDFIVLQCVQVSGIVRVQLRGIFPSFFSLWFWKPNLIHYGSLPSVDLLSLHNAKVCLGKLERILQLINFRVSFLRIHGKETYKSIDPTSILPKLCPGNLFNKMEKPDHQLFEIWVSCGFFNKQDWSARQAGALAPEPPRAHWIGRDQGKI